MPSLGGQLVDPVPIAIGGMGEKPAATFDKEDRGRVLGEGVAKLAENLRRSLPVPVEGVRKLPRSSARLNMTS